MKTLVISDIHGSASQLSKVLETPLDYDQIILVGDLMYHGPRNPILDDYNPAKVAELLNAVSKPIIAVRGNCDSEVDQMLLDFPMMGDYSRITMDDFTTHITHGHLEEPDKQGPRIKAHLYISGHTHIARLTHTEEIVYFNPGSISLPKSDIGPTYGYINDRKVSLVSLNHELLESITL